MLLSYIPLFVLLALAVIVAGVVLIFGRFFGPRHPNAKKGQPYESGMIPYGPGTRQMSVKYYLVAVLFILFDVEVIFFLPWAVAFKANGAFHPGRDVHFCCHLTGSALFTSGRRELWNGSRSENRQCRYRHHHP